MNKSIYAILALVSPIVAIFVMSGSNFAHTMIWIINSSATVETLATMGLEPASVWQLEMFVALIIFAFFCFSRSESKATHNIEWFALVLSVAAMGYYISDVDVLWSFFYKHALIAKPLTLIAISGTMSLVTRIKPWDKYAKQENVEG